MLNINDDNYEDNIKFENHEILSIPYDSFQRQRPPFFPIQSGNIPPDFDSSPSFNFPGGAFTPPGMPKSPPPNYIPGKNSAGVQGFSTNENGIGINASGTNSIRLCLYKFTYIWDINGRNYWAFLLNVDRNSVSGFRWRGNNWVYFRLNLRRIDSFVCYRSTFEDDCDDCENLRQDDISLLSSKKDYSLIEIRDVYTQTLVTVDIPEIKEDFTTQPIGYLDDNNIKSDVPSLKSRNIGYRITLEVTYPNSFDKFLKNKINESANECSNDAYKILSAPRSNDGYSNPLEIFSSSLQLIPEALKIFSSSFNAKLKGLNTSIDNYNSIAYSIREEKINANWKPYFYNNSLF